MTESVSTGFLLTDQYQLTMSQLYFKLGLQDKQAQFDHFFRDYPDYGGHKAGFCINAGLGWFYEWMVDARITETDLEFLRNHKGNSGKAVFHDDFLEYLQQQGHYESLRIDAIPEGRVIHPNVPITVVRGPLPIVQIIETALLNKVNYQILLATKAARIRLSARGQLLLEFGARRGQDLGANAGVRAALIGGADFSSNVGISHELGFPPKGTHAHSMVQLFLTMGQTELDAFRAYADLYPDNCILLVDTIDTLNSGIPNAIKVFEELRKKGHHPMGIRIDSGDLAYLCIEAAKMLNQAGFEETSIVLSNELDEMTIWQIISQISQDAEKAGIDADHLIQRLVYGVGTRLITSYGDPALGGVYKLAAVHENNEWKPSIKISENIQKIPNPGAKRLWRIYDERGKANADVLSVADENLEDGEPLTLYHPTDFTKHRSVERDCLTEVEELLVPIYDQGKQLYDFPDIADMREVRDRDLERLDSGVKRLINPHVYHVSLTENVFKIKKQLIDEFQS